MFHNQRFFDLPSQTPECQAFGVQTSPYAFVTTAMARLVGTPSSAGNSIDPSVWPGTPLIALYRQWKLSSDEPDTCTQVCSDADPTKYGCPRATFMGMANIFQSSYLTMTEPPGLSPSQFESYIPPQSPIRLLDDAAYDALAAADVSIVSSGTSFRGRVRTLCQLCVGAAGARRYRGRYVRVALRGDQLLAIGSPIRVAGSGVRARPPRSAMVS
jgi:hypothetical protein